MRQYIDFLKLRNARILIFSAFPARLAYGTVGLSIFFKAQQSTHSIAIAGFAIGLNSIAGSLTAGARGAFIDRYGQKWPLRLLVPLYFSMLILMSLAETKSQILVMAFFLGVSMPPINLSVRPLWKIAVDQSLLRTAYAIDTSVMSTTGIFGPIIATWISLTWNAKFSLQLCAIFMLIGGLALSFSKLSRQWQPEPKDDKAPPMYRIRALQLLALEGAFLGIGWGAFDIGIPAFTTQENVQSRTAIILGIAGLFNVFGGLFAGTISKRISPIKGFLRTYRIWMIACLPLAFTYPNWSMMTMAAIIGFLGGIQMVFYWEVSEAIRPKGTAVQALGWLWTIEGSFAALGSAVGGVISENYGPRWCFVLTSAAMISGYFVISLGINHFAAADRLPTEEEDVAALADTEDPAR
jgi:MFS family permease